MENFVGVLPSARPMSDEKLHIISDRKRRTKTDCPNLQIDAQEAQNSRG
jgi:hypothetical protein